VSRFTAVVASHVSVSRINCILDSSLRIRSYLDLISPPPLSQVLCLILLNLLLAILQQRRLPLLNWWPNLLALRDLRWLWPALPILHLSLSCTSSSWRLRPLRSSLIPWGIWLPDPSSSVSHCSLLEHFCVGLSIVCFGPNAPCEV
jgi:hypothetical protein